LRKEWTLLTQDFGENQNQNHADKEPGLLRGAANTGITDNTNCETSGETSETDSKTSTQLNETREERIVALCQAVGDEDGDDETVDTDDTSHNDGNDVYRDKMSVFSMHRANISC